MSVKFTEKQLDKFYNLVMDAIGNENVNDFYFNGDTRLCEKLEKVGIILVVETEDRECFRFKESNNGYVAGKDYKAIVSESGYALAVELFGDIYEQKKLRNYSRNVCWKCNGKGRIVEYGHVQGGVCFNCNGTGRNK
jgi:hypothetical protein